MQVKLFLFAAATLLSVIGATEDEYSLQAKTDKKGNEAYGLRGVSTSSSKTSKSSKSGSKSKKSSKSSMMKKTTTRASRKMSKQRKESKSMGSSSSHGIPAPGSEEDDTEDDTENDEPNDPPDEDKPACPDYVYDPDCDGNRRRTAGREQSSHS